MAGCYTCKRRARLTYGYCESCFERAVKIRGELALIVDNYQRWRPELYTFEQPSLVYCHFYRVSRDTAGFYQLHYDDRQWCIELNYENGYPSAPILRFVNPYKYSESNPMYWPDMAIKIDCIREVIDIPHVHPKSAYTLATETEVNPHFVQPHRYVEYISERILPRQCLS